MYMSRHSNSSRVLQNFKDYLVGHPNDAIQDLFKDNDLFCQLISSPSSLLSLKSEIDYRRENDTNLLFQRKVDPELDGFSFELKQ